jgi:hypothetical protein
LTVVWQESAISRDALGEWFDRVVRALTNDGTHPLVKVELR